MFNENFTITVHSFKNPGGKIMLLKHHGEWESFLYRLLVWIMKKIGGKVLLVIDNCSLVTTPDVALELESYAKEHDLWYDIKSIPPESKNQINRVETALELTFNKNGLKLTRTVLVREKMLKEMRPDLFT